MKELDDFTPHVESLFNFKGDVTRSDVDTISIALGIVASNQDQITLDNIESSVVALLIAAGNSFDRAFESLRGQYEMQWRERPNVLLAFDNYDYERRTPLPVEARAVKIALWMAVRIPSLSNAVKSQLLVVSEGDKMTFLNQ